jgi:multicomponent Na+:H+ antiporter subunit G
MLLLISNILILLGAIFMLIAALGLWRFYDLYLKLHAATKAGSLGCGLILLGVGLQLKNLHSFTEVILLIIFIAITNPISAHLIGKLHYSSLKSRNKIIRFDGHHRTID